MKYKTYDFSSRLISIIVKSILLVLFYLYFDVFPSPLYRLNYFYFCCYLSCCIRISSDWGCDTKRRFTIFFFKSKVCYWLHGLFCFFCLLCVNFPVYVSAIFLTTIIGLKMETEMFSLDDLHQV